MNALATVLTVIELLGKYAPNAIQTGLRIIPYAEDLYGQITGGKELTEEERVLLRARVDASFARAMEPLPPAQPGDPDYVKSEV